MPKQKKKKTTKKKTKPQTIVVKTNDTVIPVSTPVGSVNFDEFLKTCREPKLPINVIKQPVEEKKVTKKNKKTKKNRKKNVKTPKKKNKKKSVKKRKTPEKNDDVKPDVVTQNETDPMYPPPLFPLIKALLQPTEDDDPFQENDLFSEFVVGKTNPPIPKRQESMEEKNVIEQEANNIIDKINGAQEKIKILMQKPQLNNSEIIELEEQQVVLINLLNNFENCLARIQRVFSMGEAESTNEDDYDDNWLDVNEESKTLEKQRHPTCSITKNVVVESHSTNIEKWYEDTDLTYLLSPNTSLHNKRSLSSDILSIFKELNVTKTTENTVKRNEVFNRLKNKFNILLPPLKMKTADQNLIWLEKKFFKDHQEMINSTKNLKLFQCWNQLEFQYHMIRALIKSLKDAIKSTPPFYYANQTKKSQFVTDQSTLVQALDEIKRMTRDAFLRVGLDDYWKILPESITLSGKPCFEIVIRQNNMTENIIAPDEQITSLLRPNPFIGVDAENCKNFKKKDSKDSEIEVRNINYIL